MQQNRRLHRKLNSRGFTLVEMAVTLTIVSLLLAVTFVGLRAWMRNSEFKKCNEYAHTLYTSASLELSSLELASDLDRFTERVKASGTPLQTTAQLGTGAPENVYGDGRMYAISASAGEYAQYKTGVTVSAQASLVYELIDAYSYDKGVCSHTITMEYDTVSQSVYAVFISTKAESFVYSDEHGGDYEAYDESGVVSLNAAADYAQDRASEVRKALMVGYYCVDDLGIQAAFNEGQLRITGCYLDNAETLDLVVSSNSRHEEADVKYTVTIYQTDGDQPLFDVTYSLMDLYAKGYKEADVQTPHVIEAAVSRYNGAVKSNQTEKMYFPVAFVDHELRITLDAVMSAQTGSVIGQGGAAAANVSTGFHRFLKNTTDTPDIYASARVQQLTEDDLPLNYDQEKRGVRLWIEDEEYVIGSSVVSNTENAFFASVKDGKAGIGSVRHLANIRYYDPDKAVTFQLVRDLQFEDAVIYDQNTARAGAENAMELMELHTTKAFPEIPEFSGKWTLTGEKTLSTQDYAINQLVLTDESIVASVLQADEQYGIIGKNSGIVQHLALNGSTATLGYKAVSDAAIKYELQPENDHLKVRAAGVLCGLNQGTVKNIAMDETTSVHLALNYTPVGSAAELATAKMHGIGLVCGVHEGKVSLTDIRTAGELEGYIYRINTTDAAAPAGEDAVQQRYRYAGIGGICGFTVGEPDGITAGQTATAVGSKLTIVDRVEDFLHLADRSSVKNTAEITGNTFVGGISGNIYLVDEINSQLTDATNPIIDNCSNEGLIHLEGKKADLVACGTENAAVLEEDDAHANADNCFAGGIVGYLQKGRIRDCTSAPGVNDSAFAEQVVDAAPTGAVLEGDIQKTKAHVYLTQYLTGNYVGGIAGCVVTGELRDCQTTEGGYVLGNDEVGGIVGYLASLAQTGSGVSQNRLTMTDSKNLQNSCYVIGHSDVGGIVGSNRAGNVLSDCVNEGIVVGAGQNIGGIAGINRGSGTDKKKQAVIQNCTSEVFDYDDSIFTRVSEVWQIYGDNVGGLVGFNEYGTVTRADQTKTNISSIVVGNHNVGGVFGMAGTQTTFDFKHYTLDGGEVYANGDHAGGYIGINLSAEALPSNPYEVKPYSVRGRYAVGGAVGANVILQKQAENVQVLFSNANAFGTVYGANAVGGIIGYQRKVVLNGTFYDEVYPKLTERLPSDGMDGVFASVRPSDAADRTSIDRCETIWMTDLTTDSYAASGTTTITGDNAATVIAGSYGGGILGYGCGYDNILVKDCKNSGDVSDWQASGVTGGQLIGGSVAISDLYEKQVVSGQEHARPILDKAAYPYASMKQALGKVNQSEPIGSFVGGIQGYVSENTTISGCVQTGMIYAQNGFGGIAGINLGTLQNCTVKTNLGTQDSSLVGGLAAVNGASADVRSCTVGTTASDYTIEGKNIVGGLFAVNGAQTVSASGASRMYANISCALGGYGVGGLNGVLTGTCLLNGALGADKSGLQISGGTAVGGIAGVMCGELQIRTEKVTNDTLAVNGVDAVGGIFGVLQGGRVVRYDSTKKNADKNSDKTADYENAAAVTASNGCAGGIVGRLESGTIQQATNLGQAVVTAYGADSYAGGIVAYVEKGGLVGNCTNQADVISMNSYAGGICAWNEGTLKKNNYACEEKTQSISSDADSMGVIAAYNDGTIESCNVVKTSAVSSAAVTLQGNGWVIGGIVGTNTGTVSGCAMNVNYHFVTASDKDLTVGGAIGKNEWQSADGRQYVKNVSVNGFDLTLLGNCAYFGGLIGRSSGEGIISDCSVEDLTVGEKDASLKGSCYGGLIGENASSVQNSTVKSIHAVVSGLYQANITLDAAKQENLASCFGGLVGKNQKDGSIETCTLDTSAGYDKNQIIVENGLVGGITGINKGTVTTSGYQASGEDSAVAIADGVKNAISTYEEEYNKKSNVDQAHVDLQTERERVGYEYLVNTNQTVGVGAMIASRKTSGIPNLENILSTDNFNQQSVVQWMKNSGKPNLLLQLTGNGSIGGITAYNTQSGTMQYCVTGKWLIDNRSSSQHSAQGGVIGTNESDQDTCFLINQAMVLRESATGVTERVNGGIIGYQHNTTSDQWKIYGCINTGLIVNANSHYSGGIIGRWSDQGGSIEYCRNYGVMQTSYQAEYKGAAGGIVAQLYHPLDDQSYTVLSCRNDGSILGVGDKCRHAAQSANDSGGIIGNIVTYEANDASAAQAIQVNLIDCVNGPDVTIVSKSMCSGILTFLTSDKANSNDTALSQLELNIDRCRNYATDFVTSGGGYVGIFSDRMSGHEKTRITNCFTVAVDADIQNNSHKGYICYDGATKVSYQYDGGKGAICYNNRVLLVTTNNGKKTVDESVQLSLGDSGKSIEGNIKGGGMCYTILHSKAQHADGLKQLLEGSGAYTVSGTKEGAQLYIQLKQPMKLKELSLGFAQNATHSYRVEYLTADEAAGNKSSLTGNNFTLAREVICKEGATETVSFPKNVPVYAIRIQYVENGINQNSTLFNKYGYYYSDKQNPFVLQSLQLESEDGNAVSLDAYGGTIISPRLVDSEVTNNDRLRNGSAQYLYVANQKGRTYLIEPQFEQQRLSAGEDQRKAYQKDQYTIAGNELFTDGVRPYGMIYAMTDNDSSPMGEAGVLNCEKLDQVICDHYKTALAAAMPLADGSLLPETPDKVNVALDAEAATVNVSWANSIDGARNVVKYYLVTVKDQDGTEYLSQKKCIGNSVKLDITSDMIGKRLTVSVRAVNENGTSDACLSNESAAISKPMLTPQIRLELVKSGGTYKYEISLENQKDYEKAYAGNWEVAVYRQGTGQKNTKICSLSADKPFDLIDGFNIKEIKDGNYSPSQAIWQLYAQARSKDHTIPASERYSTSVYTPKYQSGKNDYIVPGIQTLYATFDDNYQSELDAKINVYVASDTSKTGIYPVYQVDLIRVDSEGEEHILAAKELAVSDQPSKLTFSDLPGEFFDADKTQYFYVRAWVSQTGVGPVYTWHETKTLEQNGSLLVNTTETEQKYVAGTLLSDAQAFGTRIRTTQKPEKDGATVSLSGTDANAVYAWTKDYAMTDRPSMNVNRDVTAVYDPVKDQLSYTFGWHDTSKQTQKFELRIYGKGDDGTKVLLKKKYPITKSGDRTSYRLVADDWTFDQLEVVVIQRDTGYAPGDTDTIAGKGKVVPRVLQKIVAVRTRLPKLSQPSVKLVSQNDLKYRISWQDVSSRVDAWARGDLRYALYVESDGERKLLLTTAENEAECSLEDYAGKTIQIYAVAYTDKSDLEATETTALSLKGTYFKSPVGLKKRLTVGSRLAQPVFAEAPFSWSYRDYAIDLGNAKHVLTESQFTSNALKFNIRLTANGNYVMNAVLFDTREEAQRFIDGLPGTPYAQYVELERILGDQNYKRLSEGGKPVMLSLKNKKQSIYMAATSFKDISYAGGYIVPLVRATASTDISSYWSCGTPYQIPRVMLDTPNLEQVLTEKNYASFGESLRNSVSTSGTPFTNVTVQYETYRFRVPSYVKENRLTLTAGDGRQYALTVSGDRVIVHSSEDVESAADKQVNPAGGYDYIYSLSGEEECLLDVIRNPVSGTYRASKTVRAAYRMTFDAGIRRIETDGVVTYELRLPQTRYAVTCNGGISISGTSRLITDVYIQAVPKDESRYQASAAKPEESP